MPRENIISGDLEGEGVEGHKKKFTEKSPSSEHYDSPDSEDRKKDRGDLFETGFGSAKQEKKVPAKTSGNKNDDIFETDFGSARSKKEYNSNSSIGSDSDIFSNGFGSEDAGWMSGRGRKPAEKSQEHQPDMKKESVAEKKESGDIFETDISSHPFENDEKKAAATMEDSEQKKENKDPFYTGFGYTDQRKPESSPPRSPVKSVPEKAVSPKKTEEKKIKKIFDDDDDDLFS